MEGRQENTGPGGQIAWNLVTQKEQKTESPACSCFPIHSDDLSVKLSRKWQGFPASGIFLEFGLMHLISKPIAFKGSHP